MKKYVSAAVFALLLSGCDGQTVPKDGYYLVDDIRVEFDDADDQDDPKERASFQEGIAQSIEQLKDDIFFYITPQELSYYTVDGKRTEKIKDGRTEINDRWHTIKTSQKGLVQLVTDKDMSCGFYECAITMTLKNTVETAPALVAMKQDFEQRQKEYQEMILEEKALFNRTPIVDFPGILFSPSESFSIKLPVDMYDSLEQRKSGIYLRRMAGLYVDKENAGTSIFTFNDKQKNIEVDLIVVSGKKNDFTLASWLTSRDDVLFKSQYGAVYYNTHGILEVVYFQYDDSVNSYFIGLAKVQSIEAAVKAFSALRTMDERYRGNSVATMDDLALSQAALEEKYQVKMSDYFNIEEVHQRIWQKINEILEKPGRFVVRGKSMSPIEIKFPSKMFERDIFIDLSSKSVAELLEQAQKEQPNGKLMGTVFAYGDKDEMDYDYYMSAGDGLALKFTLPYNAGNLFEKMLFLHMVRQLDLTMFPVIPPLERKNLFKYSQKRYTDSNPNDRYFLLYEGLIDNHGDMIIPNPDDGYFEFNVAAPYIVAAKWKQDPTRNIHRKTPEGFIFDEKGKLLLYTAEFKEIVEQHLAIAGDKGKLGVYDLRSRKWLVAPAYSALSWANGMFFASDEKVTGDGGIKITTALRDYLFNSEGRLVAKGKNIEQIDGTDRYTIADESGNVGLMNKQGHLLFSHKGLELDYIPEIDAYALTTGTSKKDERVAIVSEKGETIIPPEYKFYRVVQEGYLQMWLTDFKQSTLFELDKVRHWRENQPLKGEPLVQ